MLIEDKNSIKNSKKPQELRTTFLEQFGKAAKSYSSFPVDGRSPANQVRLVILSHYLQGLIHPSDAGFLPSTISLETKICELCLKQF